MTFAGCTAAHSRARSRALSVLAVAALPALACLAIAGGAAAETSFGNAGCVLTDGESGIVADVLDPVTVRLDSGLMVRLAGIIPPGDVDGDAAAMDALTGLTLGNPVRLRYGGLSRDRYQRATAQLYLIGGPEIWLQSALISSGHAIVAGFAEDRSCLAALLAVEREARDAGAGLWLRRSPTDAWSGELRSGGARFELVEGEVVSIGRRERTVYLNFGHDWSTDFTVSLAVADADTIEAEGGSFDDLVGRRIRIRGWLDQWDGPWIRVDHAEQIELLSEGN
jgi:endonuclease YncB( thermonuclease family)